MRSLKYRLFQYLKNTPGWSSGRKIVVFSVDDYGNIRIASRQARENLKKAGLEMDANRFDQYDALETREDLTLLFETLHCVRDKENRPAVFTAFALPANIDFCRMEKEDFSDYRYQLLPDNFKALPGYEGTWDIWKEGVAKGFFVPQFHGREHVNVSFLTDMMRKRHPLVMACLRERSWAGLNIRKRSSVDYVSAFTFEDPKEHSSLADIASDGLKAFEKVFGFKARHFNAPGSPAHRTLEKTLADGGIKYVDTSFVRKEHQGHGKYRYSFNYQGKMNHHGQTYQIRNCVFEPLLYRNRDSVDLTLAEIEIAFRLKKPAIISSHRVNFGGLMDPNVRGYGLSQLKRLLKTITKRWPDVEFMSSNELGDIMNNRRHS